MPRARAGVLIQMHEDRVTRTVGSPAFTPLPAGSPHLADAQRPPPDYATRRIFPHPDERSSASPGLAQSFFVCGEKFWAIPFPAGEMLCVDRPPCPASGEPGSRPGLTS